MKSIRSRAELKSLQRQMAEMLFQPLTPQWRMRKEMSDGRSVRQVAAEFIKPNDRLDSFARLEIYNRCYWFRILDSLYDDFPGLLALLGNRKFLKLATAYLARYPSASFTLRNLGSRLESFLDEEPQWIAPREAMAMDMVRFEWAQIVAFDGPSLPPVSADALLDQPSDRLRLGIQPHVSLLTLEYAVDHYLIAVKKQESDRLRSEASNTTNAAPEARTLRRRVRPPKRERVHLAVHRHDNMLYYKRLEPAAFALLTALREGGTLDEAFARAMEAAPDPNTDWPGQVQAWFANWSSLGWLTAPNPKISS